MSRLHRRHGELALKKVSEGLSEPEAGELALIREALDFAEEERRKGYERGRGDERWAVVEHVDAESMRLRDAAEVVPRGGSMLCAQADLLDALRRQLEAGRHDLTTGRRALARADALLANYESPEEAP